ncbi:SIR2 family protein [Arthrobacter sp. Soil764]|uniref:SIR2 family protein n=1 Tax=Arthrobacter sp. Soil764 TaxID=1736403 RepID=UPI0006F24D14|nr:SIR2 family protein [Arthrobacter sp. Soil764]KRE90125.1 hypothetical protein ASG86_17645 [Arthrobacter sp. Soil764]
MTPAIAEVPGDREVTVLLGAGASVEAGLPTSTRLTEQILNGISNDNHVGRSVAGALNMAVGAMIAHDTARGGAIADGIDVERVFAAVRMLSHRDDLEVSPFISAWNPYLNEVDKGPAPRLSSTWGRKFMGGIADATERAHRTTKLQDAFQDGVRALTRQNQQGTTFKLLEQAMLLQLRTALKIDAERIGYLAPVLTRSASNTRVATLNYDLSLESFCEANRIQYDTGIEQWSGGFNWHWNNRADLRLLKLHGSLDWQYTNERQGLDAFADDDIAVRRSEPSDEDLARGSSPALVFGHGTKLRAEGPFLAMLKEFDQFLEDSNHLVIVGYSMRDEHINAAIKRWVNSRLAPVITIIDPYPPDAAAYWDHNASFYSSLLARIENPAEHGLSPSSQLICETAAVGLLKVFGISSQTGTGESQIGGGIDGAAQ